MHTEVLFWSLSPQVTTEASTYLLWARAQVLGRSFFSALQRGRSSSLGQDRSLHTRESSVGFPAVPRHSVCLLLALAAEEEFP